MRRRPQRASHHQKANGKYADGSRRNDVRDASSCANCRGHYPQKRIDGPLRFRRGHPVSDLNEVPQPQVRT